MNRPISDDSRVLILGGSGILGSALQRALKRHDKFWRAKVFAPTHNTLEIHDMDAVVRAYRDIQPTHIFNCSAMVGGVGMDDAKENFNYFVENFMLQFEPLFATKAIKDFTYVNVSSICAYPKEAEQPLGEYQLFDGQFDTVNEGYCLSKAVGIKMAEYLRSLTNQNIISVIPCNMYGTGDNFTKPPLHVVASMVKKFCDAVNKDEIVTLWGDGTPVRDFLHCNDMADAILEVAQFYEGSSAVNIGSGTLTSIKDLSVLIATATGFKNSVVWDSSKPNGTPAKYLDIQTLRRLGWSPQISLKDGVEVMVKDYREKYLAS